MKIYLVGGAVRDRMLGLRSKDLDYAVEAESYEAMRKGMIQRGYKIFLETPQYLTIRAMGPEGPADFTLCRRDGEYSDGRRPDSVEPGTLLDDLSRRDFTVNAMALDLDGELIDPFNGLTDLEDRTLSCVGSAEERFTEDALRALRALRFSITKNLVMDDDIQTALRSEWLPPLMVNVSTERKRDELLKCFRHNTMITLALLQHATSYALRKAVFTEDLWLEPTMKER